VKRPVVIAVVGVTAGGKTAVGELLAARIGGEIVCADSRQVFRELELGTGKPEPAERSDLPHHLFEARTLEGGPAGASAGWFADAACAAGALIHRRGAIPVLVGGSGLYLRAAMRGLAPVPEVAPEVKHRIQAELEAEGPIALHQRLCALDPITAARLEPADRQRVARALEVLESSGHSLAWWHDQGRSHAMTGTWRVFELTLPAAPLRRRIAERTRWMFENGLIEETRGLLERGLGPALKRLRAVGYDEAMAVLEGASSAAEAERVTTLRTGQLAKRQRTWFRHQVEATRLEAGADAGALAARIAAAIAGPG
jgi:tRNA dimethylallyltransferase